MRIKTWIKVLWYALKKDDSLDHYSDRELEEIVESGKRIEKKFEKTLLKLEDKGYKMAKSKRWRHLLVDQLGEEEVDKFVKEYESERGIK